jgi:hypothetical protein
MEGTLGAADRVTFREGMREAALSASLAQVRFARRAREAPHLNDEGLPGAGFSIPASKRVCDRRCPS